MSEDNVIRPTFGGRKTETAQAMVPVAEIASSSDGTADFEQDVVYCYSNFALVWNANIRGDEMTNYLFDDVGYEKTDSSLHLRRPVVRGYTFEQFCERLCNSSRAEWRAQPAFFGALFIEFHARQNAILAYLEEQPELVETFSDEDMKTFLKLLLRADS